MPALPGPDEGQGGVGGQVLQAELPAGSGVRGRPDLDEQLAQWTAEIADLRVHGTTHERPRDRFTREQPTLIATATQPSFRLAARVPRVVAEDYLVSFETNRYSVPFTLIGQTVEVLRRDSQLDIFHQGWLVVTHPLLAGQYQLRILPEHGRAPSPARPAPPEDDKGIGA